MTTTWSVCGCLCVCHVTEGDKDWPGSCIACCEPGMDCECGRALIHLIDTVDAHAAHVAANENHWFSCPLCDDEAEDD